jgi:transposase
LPKFERSEQRQRLDDRYVERFFNRIKQCRRVATRCDRLAANYPAFVQLASIRLWLRLNESAP